jgi:acyl-coenzyme A synthetase/AMP-(fatty) acid ligase/surfactin synthase thioesterase subunit
MTVFERFAAIAEAYPAELAYTDRCKSLRYSDLAAMAKAARAKILSLAPPQAGFVGILTADRVNALTAMLGAAASGHAYVLLDANDPDKRLVHINDEVSPFALLADEALLPRATSLANGGTPIVDLDNLEPWGGEEIAGPPVTPDALLYVSFTSGSTGVPKGVCQTHRNLAFYVDAYIDTMGIRAGDPISWLFAHGASASNMDIYGALFKGAQLSAFELRDESFASMARWIEDQRIALLHTVPTVVRGLVGALGEEQRFATVRVVDLAGEMLFANDVVRMRPHFREDCRIHNRLAATEASFVSSLMVTRDHERSEGALPVGKPIEGVEIAILRPDGSPADVGETGAIAICSPHLCVGYLNRPDLDADFSDIDGRPGWRRYKSADVGFIDRAGNLNFIGRSGSRIKLRGNAVDLAEVEAALYACPGVTGAVVLPRSEGGEEAREILAYLTLADGGALEAGTIRKHLAQSLPAYMLPSGYVFLDELPSTATSKVDRKALAELDLAKVRFRADYVPPADELEETVARIFSEVLGQSPVGRLDDFFLLGGDSLSLVNLQVLATEFFGQQFSKLHEEATVMGIAQWLREADGDVAESGSPILLPIKPDGSNPPLFAVHGRRGQANVSPHFLELLGDNQPLYALQAQGLDGKQEPLATVEEMAAKYIEAIKEVQPKGPYFLGGFCAGCFIALEMLRMLRREGESYYAPLLIDPPPTVKAFPKNPEDSVLKRMELRVKAGDWNLDLKNPRAVSAALKVAGAIDNALDAYNPSRLFPVRSMIIATTRRWKEDRVVRYFFGRRAEVFLIDGGHLNVLSPDNKQFADAIRKCIAHVSRLAEFHRAKLAQEEAERRRIPAERDPA